MSKTEVKFGKELASQFGWTEECMKGSGTRPVILLVQELQVST